MKATGYRLHFEGTEGKAKAFKTMAQVREAIREAAKEAGATIKQATKCAYIVTEEEYQKEQEAQ